MRAIGQDITVTELQPGDVLSTDSLLGFDRFIHVAQTEHPVWPSCRLVVWRRADGEWFHDALDPRQVLGPLVHVGGLELVRAALAPGGSTWAETLITLERKA